MSSYIPMGRITSEDWLYISLKLEIFEVLFRSIRESGGRNPLAAFKAAMLKKVENERVFSEKTGKQIEFMIEKCDVLNMLVNAYGLRSYVFQALIEECLDEDGEYLLNQLLNENL